MGMSYSTNNRINCSNIPPLNYDSASHRYNARARFKNGRAASRSLSCIVLSLTLCLPGCGYLVRQKADQLSQDFATAVMQQEDTQMVAEALPAYLLLMDTLVHNSPENGALAMADARLKATFSSSFITDSERQKIFAEQAWVLARRSACLQENPLCEGYKGGIDEIDLALDWTDESVRKLAYDFTSVWITWIQVNKDDWNAIAQLAKAERLMSRVAEHDPAIDYGNALVYLGVMNSLVPAALGGKPEKGRDYFEKAIGVSDGRNLMAKVLYAEFYARLVFDQALHDRLVNEVLDATYPSNGLKLSNALAKRRATLLRESAKDYF